MYWLLLVCLVGVDPQCETPVSSSHPSVVACLKEASVVAQSAMKAGVITASVCHPIFKEA